MVAPPLIQNHKEDEIKTIATSLLIVLCSITVVNGELIFKQDFEDGLADWTAGFDLPDDPNNPGNLVVWEVVPSDERVFAGDRSLKLFIDGRQDDGTVWLAGEFPSYPRQNTDVNVNFRFWSPFKGGFNNLAFVVGYVGPKEPRAERDFKLLTPIVEVGEWDLLSFSFSVPPNKAESVWVAVGFTVTWESEQTYYIDDVVVEVSASEPTAVEAISWGQIKSKSRR